MKSRLRKAWETLKSNRGSSVVLVFVAISCITLMTTSLLHLSYTAFKLKAAERQNKVEFYEADARMDELVAELQNEVSDAIKKAQKEVLVSFSAGNADVKFRKELVKELAGKLGSADGTCNTDYLSTLLSDVTITKDEHSVYERDDAKFVLKNIFITYTSAKSGNSTTIVTDIILDASKLRMNSKWDIENTVKLENWRVE